MVDGEGAREEARRRRRRRRRMATDRRRYNTGGYPGYRLRRWGRTRITRALWEETDGEGALEADDDDRGSARATAASESELDWDGNEQSRCGAEPSSVVELEPSGQPSPTPYDCVQAHVATIGRASARRRRCTQFFSSCGLRLREDTSSTSTTSE